MCQNLHWVDHHVLSVLPAEVFNNKKLLLQKGGMWPAFKVLLRRRLFQFNKIILPVKNKPRLLIVAITGTIPLKNATYKTQFPEKILVQNLTARGIFIVYLLYKKITGELVFKIKQQKSPPLQVDWQRCQSPWNWQRPATELGMELTWVTMQNVFLKCLLLQNNLLVQLLPFYSISLDSFLFIEQPNLKKTDKLQEEKS